MKNLTLRTSLLILILAIGIAGCSGTRNSRPVSAAAKFDPSAPVLMTISLGKSTGKVVRFSDFSVGTHKQLNDSAVDTTDPNADDYFDIELTKRWPESKPDNITIGCNGTRNLAHIGIGDEAAFRRFVKSLNIWWADKLEPTARTARLAASVTNTPYWTPVSFEAKPGMIFATRTNNRSAGDVGTLIFIKSIDKTGKLTFLVSRKSRK